MPKAVDVSNYNGELTDEWCTAVKAAGVALVIVRLSTESEHDQAEITARQVAVLARNQVPWQGYLWAYWNSDPGVLWDAAQAQLPPGWPGYSGRNIWIDCEDGDPDPYLGLLWLVEYGRILEAADFQPGIYTSPYWWKNNVRNRDSQQVRILGEWPLWVAYWDWAMDCAKVPPFGAWTGALIKQTGQTSLDGVPGAVGVDWICE